MYDHPLIHTFLQSGVFVISFASIQPQFVLVVGNKGDMRPVGFHKSPFLSKCFAEAVVFTVG